MIKNCIPRLISAVLILMILASLVMCVFWLPLLLDYASGFVDLPKTAMWIICGVIEAVLLVIFGVAFAFASEVKNDTIFSVSTSRRLKLISGLLFADCALFIAGILGLLICGECLLSPAFLCVGFIGLVVSCVLFILSNYIKSAAELKEEVDYTL